MATIKRLRECIDKKWVTGKGIRWIIEDAHGHNDYCIHCGNMANGVVIIKTDARTYNLPFCKSHASKLPEPPEYAPFRVTIERYHRRANIRKHQKPAPSQFINKNIAAEQVRAKCGTCKHYAQGINSSYCAAPLQKDERLKQWAYYNLGCSLHAAGKHQTRIDYIKEIKKENSIGQKLYRLWEKIVR